MSAPQSQPQATRDPRDELPEHLPALRAFAISLTRNVAVADDLVQDTIVKAWTNFDKFTEGTNLRAWLFTILRNTFYSDKRKHRREVPDPEGGAGRPIVAISNAKLAEYTMRSERTVIRCIRRLVEVGVAAYRDSSTGRRFVYRNSEGEISAGYGIDFTPSRVRIAELKSAVDQYQNKLNRELAAKRDISRLSRAIADICEAFPEQAANWSLRVNELHGATLSLEGRADECRALHATIVEESAASDLSHHLSCKGDINVTPYINTTHESLFESRNNRTRSNERDIIYPSGSKAAEEAFEKKPAGTVQTKQARSKTEISHDSETIQGEVLASVSIGLLQVACREAQAMIAARFDSWSALGRAGESLRRMIGLSEAGWVDGRTKVGLYAASAILATVLEKSIRDPDQISKPAGYFRAMIDRAVDGKLNLERSLFGLAEGSYETLRAAARE